MLARYWLLPLFALALLAFPAHGRAQADAEQFVVTYVEFLPAEQDRGGELVEQLAALGRRNGAISFTANEEIQRPNFFVLLEIGRTRTLVRSLKIWLRHRPCWLGYSRCLRCRSTSDPAR